jgi:hypothetical protein
LWVVEKYGKAAEDCTHNRKTQISTDLKYDKTIDLSGYRDDSLQLLRCLPRTHKPELHAQQRGVAGEAKLEMAPEQGESLLNPALHHRKGLATFDVMLLIGGGAVSGLLYAAAVTCGKAGLLQGRFFEGLYYYSWPILGLIFFGRAVWLSFRSSVFPTVLRSVAIAICIGAFALSYHKLPFLDSFQASVQRAYDMAEIESWGIEILKNIELNETKPLQMHEHPTWATDGRFTVPNTIVVHHERTTDAKYIKVIWGSGVVGQWGLVVGPPEMPKRGRLLYPGIYFYVNPTPLGWRE